VIIAALLGALTWSLAEYLLHRFAGHWPRGKIEFSREHLAHHAAPTYFTPTAKKARTALSITAIAAAPMLLGFGAGPGSAAIGGFLIAYVGYELTHRLIHVRRPPPYNYLGAYGRLIRRHHLHHHFAAPRKNHGVTSPIWDVVFGTYERPERVRVPARHALVWMVDGEGALLPAYARDYELRVPRRRPPGA
jgi:sterol desaturase/sphingolipid hydroxylase (fatty acid hydroxylase superfamily)